MNLRLGRFSCCYAKEVFTRGDFLRKVPPRTPPQKLLMIGFINSRSATCYTKCVPCLDPYNPSGTYLRNRLSDKRIRRRSVLHEQVQTKSPPTNVSDRRSVLILKFSSRGKIRKKTAEVFLRTFFHPFGVYQKGVSRKGNKRFSLTQTG